jgi:nucleoid DNA-binding protein
VNFQEKRADMGDVTRRFVSEMFVMAAKRAGVPVKAAKQMFNDVQDQILRAVASGERVVFSDICTIGTAERAARSMWDVHRREMRTLPPRLSVKVRVLPKARKVVQHGYDPRG